MSGAQARIQLADVERLGQVVVGAAVEPLDPGFDAVPGGQHQHRHLGAARPEALADLQAVDERQHDVEDHRVVVGDGDELDDVPAIACDVHGVGLLAQALRQHLCRVRFVFDQKDAHRVLFCVDSRRPEGRAAGTSANCAHPRLVSGVVI